MMDRRAMLAVIPVLVGAANAQRNPRAVTQTCSICKFYKLNPHNTQEGLCRRYPLNYKTFSGGHPIVKATDWCGEFAQS